MNILLLGYGKEGQAAEKYFKEKGAHVDIVENITKEEAAAKDYSGYDMVFRSPSLHPFKSPVLTSVTKYFFDHCPCPIIGVTATKGKGTTCSFIKSILDSLGEDAYLVGNIGNPSIDVLDNLKSTSVVVYEMSSFQLWDLTVSPHIAVIGTIEPDHLNVHDGFDDYINAKANICRYQSADDFCIYYKNNPDSVKIAANGSGQKVTYPYEVPEDILSTVTLPGNHNKDNAIAAIAAVASYKNLTPEEFITEYSAEIKSGLSSFKGLPHRLEFVKKVGNVRYYDDNFSTNPASTRVAVNAFPDENVVIIVGGRDKTMGEDLPEIYEVLKAGNVKHIILMGESGHELFERYEDSRFTLVKSLREAVSSAVTFAEKYDHAVVLMSPSAASFDMFKNVYDRGDQYKLLISNL